MNPENSILTLAERIEMKERAKKRALDRIEEREHLRLELNARGYIQTCHEIIDALTRGDEIIKDDEGRAQRVPLDRARVAALSKAMDGSLRLLDRVLPPLKAVEVTDSPERQANEKLLSTGELVELILKERRKQPQVIEAEVVEEKPPWEN